MPPYAQHVVVRTGMDDWASRIEEEEAGTGVNFVRGLKELVGRGGRFFDVCMVCLVGWLDSFIFGLLLVVHTGDMGHTERERERKRADTGKTLARKTGPYNE